MSIDYSRYSDFLIERPTPGVLLVTLNRPQALNAVTYSMHRDLARIWTDVADDDETNAVVITGAGRGFCSGNDLRQPRLAGPDRLEMTETARKIVYGMIDLGKPIVSAINGPAVGVGTALAMLADISIAGDDVEIFEGHVQMGVAAGDHACLVWPLLCGMAKAKYYIMTGEPVRGAEAERIGLVSRAVPASEVVPTAIEVASRLAQGPQQALRFTKNAINQWYRQSGTIYEMSRVLEVLGAVAGPDVEAARAAFAGSRKSATDAAS